MSRTTRTHAQTGHVATLLQRWLDSNRAYGDAMARWAHPGPRTTRR